ncbi:MAG: AEC family transporter [Puniceicoccales bacterium]|jgi:predicted permease|nr:AEC family transporter [Puniceicoccales bacterium]
MNSPSSSVLTAVLPVLAIVGTGFFLRKRGLVEASAQASMMRVVLWVLMPCLVLDRVPHNAALNSGWLAMAAPVAGFLSVVAGLLVAWYAAPLFGIQAGTPRRTFAYCTSIYNYGYVAIPLCQVLVGQDAVAVMLLFNAGIEVGIWTAGLMVLSGRLTREAWKKLVNPMTVGSILALALNKTGAAPHMPGWLCATFSTLGACAIPLGILMVGMALPALLAGFSWRNEPRAAAGACLLRNGIIPVVMLAPVAAGKWAWLPELPTPLGPILMLQASMSAGIFSIVVVQHFNGDPRMALRVAIYSSLGAIVTLPLWLEILSAWLP